MSRFSDDALLSKALRALEDVYARAREGPIEPSPELRFLLAYLAKDAPERWPHDLLWKEATRSPGSTKADQFGRRQSLTAAVNGIKLQIDRAEK